MGFCYVVRSDHFDFVKVGKWTGTLIDLQYRYAHCYSRLGLSVDAFPVTGSETVESLLKKELAQWHVVQEFYRKEKHAEILQIVERTCERMNFDGVRIGDITYTDERPAIGGIDIIYQNHRYQVQIGSTRISEGSFNKAYDKAVAYKKIYDVLNIQAPELPPRPDAVPE
jgi:hypothetical protein